MAKDEKFDASEIRKWMGQAIDQGKVEGYVLEESMLVFQGLSRMQAKALLDSVVEGRTPENPVVFGMDATPRRRAAPHLDRLHALQHEDAALRAAGRPSRIQTPGPAPAGSEHVVFHNGKRQILKVKPACRHNGKKFACITHGLLFTSEAEYHAHCSDTHEHNTTETEFDAPSLSEGHVTALWCDHVSKETVQNFMGVMEPLWVQHGLEALKG